MEPAPSSKEKKTRSGLYFGIATGLLFLLAFVWSVDPSFVYILTGFILVFGLLGFRNSNLVKQFTTETARPAAGFTGGFRSTAKTPTENQSSSPRRTRINKPLIMAIIIGFFISMIVFIVIILSQDNVDYDSQWNYERAEIFYNQAEYDSAAIYYRRAFAFNAKNEEALAGYGNVLMMREQYDSAILYYDKALTANPAYDKATYQKAAVLSYQKKYQQSIALLKILLGENPSYVDALQLIGDNYYTRQQYDSALNWYTKAYEGGVRNRYLFHLMGYIQETKGNNSSAIKLYQEALQYDSSVVDIYQRLGALLPGPEGNFYRQTAADLENKN